MWSIWKVQVQDDDGDWGSRALCGRNCCGQINACQAGKSTGCKEDHDLQHSKSTALVSIVKSTQITRENVDEVSMTLIPICT